MSRRVNRVAALLIGVAVVAAGNLVVAAAPASAGQVGATVSIRGSGLVQVVEGTLDGGSVTCDRRSNLDDRVVNTCPRMQNNETFEAWIWLRALPNTFPAGHWNFVGWQGCDTTRSQGGFLECGVHSGPFDAVERPVLAQFDDSRAPAITSLTEVGSTTVERTFFYSFSADEQATFQCRFDSGPFLGCQSGVVRTFETEGPHTFDVRAFDGSGNLGVTSSRTVTVVDTAVTGGPVGLVNRRQATFAFASAAGTTFKCALDSLSFQPCGPGTAAYDGLADGQHTFRVYAETGGYRDSIPAVRTWTIDATPPETMLTGADVSGTSAAFRFSADAEAFECRVSMNGADAAWQACLAPAELVDLADGAYHFEVRAVDAAGNVDANPAEHRWTVDRTAPETALSSGPKQGSFVVSRSASFALSSTEPGSTFSCSLDGVVKSCSEGSVRFDDLARRTHVFTGVAADAAGNVDFTAVQRTWTVPLNNTDLRHGRGWSKRSSAKAYLGTYSLASRESATLTKRVSGARKLVLVATKAPGAGKVRISAGAKVLGTISLASRKARMRQLIPIATLRKPFNGTLKIKVITSGKPVRIEGLGVATR